MVTTLIQKVTAKKLRLILTVAILANHYRRTLREIKFSFHNTRSIQEVLV